MLTRFAARLLPRLREGYPVIAITGPRQSGKSTFAQQESSLPLINLEDPVELARHRQDLRGLFASYPTGAIIDEAQHLPELFPALQAHVDANPHLGRWIITGSQNFALSRQIGQSLAGRAANVELLPFSYAELRGSPRCPQTMAHAIFQGGYAPLYDQNRNLDTVRWLNDYVANFTYGAEGEHQVVTGSDMFINYQTNEGFTVPDGQVALLTLHFDEFAVGEGPEPFTAEPGFGQMFRAEAGPQIAFSWGEGDDKEFFIGDISSEPPIVGHSHWRQE